VAALVGLPYVVHLSRLAGQFRWEGKTAINERMTPGVSYSTAARGLDVDAEFDRATPYLGGPEL
jgi:hypothetical protein